jgi:rhomboid protease GluP
MEIPSPPPPVPQPLPPQVSYEIVKQTWLTKKPKESGGWAAALGTFSLALGSLMFLKNVWNAAEWMPASGEKVFGHFEIWRLWTTLFAHGDFGHLASNALLFFTLGFFLYGYFGVRLFPVGAFFWGGITNLFALATYDPETLLIGASGIVYWMGGAWLVLYFFLSRQKNLTNRLLRTLGVAILIFMPAETFEPQVSYRTHLIGFIFGVGSGAWHYYAHRAIFLKAEIKETIFEDADPGADPSDTQSST